MGTYRQYLFFQCQQLVLRHQIAALTKLWKLPPEFEVCAVNLPQDIDRLRAWTVYGLCPTCLPVGSIRHRSSVVTSGYCILPYCPTLPPLSRGDAFGSTKMEMKVKPRRQILPKKKRRGGCRKLLTLLRTRTPVPARALVPMDASPVHFHLATQTRTQNARGKTARGQHVRQRNRKGSRKGRGAGKGKVQPTKTQSRIRTRTIQGGRKLILF